MNKVVAGVVAGAAGTTALNVTTYLDMALRGRPASTIPEEAVARFGEKLGLAIAPQAGQPSDTCTRAANRQAALGALGGFLTGLAAGALYGIARPRSGLPLPLGGLAAGLGAMALSDVPLTLSRFTDPRSWGAAGWASDVVPHLAFGFATAFTFDALAR